MRFNMATFSNDIITNTKPVTTSFLDDGETKEADYNAVIDGGDYLVMEMSLRDFMAKPRLVSAGLWATGSTPAQLLETIDPATEIWGAGKPDIWRLKVKGYRLYRATAVVTIVINANPFQQGRLLLHFLPYGAAALPLINNSSLTKMSQHPHVELDCRDTSCTLTIPYVSPQEWMVAADAQDNTWGKFFLNVYTPLYSPGTITEVEYSIFMHFEDFEVTAPVTPQSGAPSGKRMKARRMKANEDKERIGPTVSMGLAGASKVAGGLSSIPSLAPLMVPVAWALSAASGVASFFGWSKPMLATPSLVNAAIPGKYLANADGEFAGGSLALINNNRVELTNNSVYEGDEMSLTFLKSVEAYATTLTWDTTQAINTDIAGASGILLRPQEFCTVNMRTFSGHTLTSKDMHPVGFLADFFRFYRGGMKLTFKFVKTQFHTGRLQFSYVPINSNAITTDVSNGHYLMREIVDIVTTDEYSVVLPYLNECDYLEIDQIMGTLHINVVNQLRAPDSVEPLLKIIVTVSFCDDFELQVPYARNDRCMAVVTQSGTQITTTETPTAIDVMLGGRGPKKNSTRYSSKCIGEHFSSIRQLLSRFTPSWTYPTLATATTIYPWTIGTISINTSSGAMTGNSYVGNDTFAWLLPMYAFYRGGMRVAFHCKNGTNIDRLVAVNTGQTTGISTFGANSTLGGYFPNATLDYTNVNSGSVRGPVGSLVTDRTNNMLQVEIPYYCKTRMSKVRTDLTTTIPTYTDTPLSSVSILSDSTAQAVNSYARAISEDFQTFYFIGAPSSFYHYA